MITTEVNPFGNAIVQPWLTAAPTEAGRSILQNNSVFVLPAANQAHAQPGLTLFNNESGFGNFLNFLVGSNKTISTASGNKPTGSVRFESFSWEEAFDPETGLPRETKQPQRVPGFLDTDSFNPFQRSLDLVS